MNYFCRNFNNLKLKEMKTNFLLVGILLCTLNIDAQVYDCNGIVNGPAVVDSCGTCQLAYLYNYITHDIKFLNTTEGVSAGTNEMLVNPQDQGNPYWNDCGQNYEVDCNNFVYGPALTDTCNFCRQAYAYDYITHQVTYVNHTDLYELSENETMVMPDDASNPYWNDCSSSVYELTNEPLKLLKIVNLLGYELNRITPNAIFIEVYSDGSYQKRLIVK